MRSDDVVGRWMMLGFALSPSTVRGRFLLSVRLSGESLTITGPPVRTDLPEGEDGGEDLTWAIPLGI